MNIAQTTVGEASAGKYSGLGLDLAGLGKVRLTQLLSKNGETEVYRTAHPGVVVKMFDLSCDKPDEVSYGPYLAFGLELANFEDVRNVETLRPFVPTYYGADINYQAQYAMIAMESLTGQDLKSWCREMSASGQTAWVEELRAALFEAMAIVRLFHQQGMILIDFKPDHIFRFSDKSIKFVDLGALFTPRRALELEKYVYSATPEHAEVAIDAPNVQTGRPPTVASDIFSAGVAFFELAAGSSRLAIDPQTAEEILSTPAVFRFRDTQIKDLWRAYPALKHLLPTVEMQLQERQLLFAEFWHVLKGYVANKVSDWESLAEDQQGQILLSTGTTFILEQLAAPLQWLAGPIAQATVLRGLRLRNIEELMATLAQPVAAEIRDDVREHNGFICYLADLDRPVAFVDQLNTWDVRQDESAGHWALAAPLACAHAADSAEFTFLKETYRDADTHRFYQIVGDLEADSRESGKLTLRHLQNDRFAWLGR